MLTPEDLEQIRAAIRESIVPLATRADIAPLATREQLDKTETRLLTEFHKWASPIEMRVRSHAAALRAMDAELEAQADRIKKLEDAS